MRLIDADALIEKCKDIVFKYPDGTEYRHRCVDPFVIMEMPTIEPKTGRWIMKEKGIHATQYKCSECGRVVWDDTGYDVRKDYPYCHCGARMEQ